jgi:mRNA (guanine-N7-)-methyltransferase
MEVKKVPLVWEEYKNTVIEGELVITKGDYFLYTYEPIFFKGEKVLENIKYDLKQRLNMLFQTVYKQEIDTEKIETRGRKANVNLDDPRFGIPTGGIYGNPDKTKFVFEISVKPFYFVNEEMNLSKLFNYVSKQYAEDLKNEKVDGIMFVETEQPYSRNNTHLKWKPVNLLTIDFEVTVLGILENSKYVVDLLDSYGNIYANKVEIGVKKFGNTLYSGDIVEFQYLNQKFIPYRIRHDKPKANNIKVIQSNMDQIKYPFNLKQLSANNPSEKSAPFFNLKRFNNFVKRKMLEDTIKHSHVKSILDLGCGKGQDLKKYIDNGVKNVTGYDISQGYINEAIRRLETYKSSSSLKDLNYSYHVADLRTDKLQLDYRSDAVVMNFMIHYLFESEQSFSNLMENILKNISTHGIIIITYLDGEKIRKNLKDKETYFVGKHFKIQNGQDNKVQKPFGKSIKVSMDNTVASNSDEFLVAEKDLSELFSASGFSVLQKGEFDKFLPEWVEKGRNFLNNEEQEISTLNKYIVFRKN